MTARLPSTSLRPGKPRPTFGVASSELAVVGDSGESFERHDPHKAGMNEVFVELARRVVVTQRPAIASEDQVSAIGVLGSNGVGETHHFERHLLLGRAAGLLPLKRDQ